MKLLVTGAGGLLGTRVSELALKQNHEVFSIYNQHVPQYGTPIKLDITEKTGIRKSFEKAKPEAVVHAAAFSDVDKCEKEKEFAWKTNVEATANIAQTCSRENIFLVYVSTDYVFNGEKGNYKEIDPTDPINYYGLTKLKGEEQVKQSNAIHCIARTSVIYGSTPAAGKTNFALWLINKVNKNEEAKIITDQWNSPTLNTNLAEMILEIVENRITGTFHLAGATRLSRYEFAQDIAETFNLDKNCITPASSKEISWFAKRPKDASLNVDRAKVTLKHKPLQISEALIKLKTEMV